MEGVYCFREVKKEDSGPLHLVLTGADKKNSNPFNVNRGLVLTETQGMRPEPV